MLEAVEKKLEREQDKLSKLPFESLGYPKFAMLIALRAASSRLLWLHVVVHHKVQHITYYSLFLPKLAAKAVAGVSPLQSAEQVNIQYCHANNVLLTFSFTKYLTLL